MKKQRWIDLSAHEIYLGSITMADGIERMALLDMKDAVPASRLRETGFLPFEGSPRYEKGIYYLDGDQALRPSGIAAAIGIAKCPVVEVSIKQIESVFRAKCMEKFQANLNAVTLRAESLGLNADGHNVYQTPAGRFVRTAKDEAVVERSSAGMATDRALFLRASTNEELRKCADGFVMRVQQGSSANWTDLVKFGSVIFGKAPSDGDMHRLQESVEAAAYSAFSKQVSDPDQKAFKAAQDLYYGLPVARMRTSESVALQQYSTPLPMSVVSQRLLLGADEVSGKSVLDPTGGNGGLLNLIPQAMSTYAIELDRKRLDAMGSNPRIQAQLGDATEVPFRARFGEPDGFDYIIANPPFGSMEEAKSFDKIPRVQRIDHFIALRSLEARKANGRAVLIVGADSRQSDGTVKGGAKSFLNYIHDHYDVHGCVELDGRMYARNGAGYNVRLMVVGNRLAQPGTASVPEKLPILSSYEELWQWSSKVIKSYPAAGAEAAKDVVVTKPAPDVGDIISVRGGEYNGTIRTLISAVQGGYEVSDSVKGRIVVEDVELHRKVEKLIAKLGDRIRFTAYDLGSDLSAGIVEGLVVDAASTTSGNTRYRVLTDILAPQGGGNLEKLLYSHQGAVEVLPPAPLNVDDLRVALSESAPMADVPAGWIVMNAPRPILGTQLHEGEFLKGIFYAAIDPQDAMAARQATENRKLAASVVLVVSQDEQVGMALAHSRYRDRYYDEMDAGQRFAALNGPIRNLNDMTFGDAKVLLEEARAYLTLRDLIRAQALNATPVDDAVAEVVVQEPSIDASVLDVASTPAFTTEANPPSVTAAVAVVPVERNVNSFQAPYQAASKLGPPSAMVPINMAGSTYAALNDLESRHGPVDEYVAKKLRYSTDKLGEYFSPEQIDALGLSIQSVEDGRGAINADQTGMGKGRFVAGMMRYAKLHDRTPIFVTIKPELFTDIFRDIHDIGSEELFKKLFIFNDGVNVMRYGTESEVLYRATTLQERRAANEGKQIDDDVDMVLATYSQFQRAGSKNLKAQLLAAISQDKTMLFLDESHVAAGASNIAAAVGVAVANSGGVIYSSATPLKGVSNFAIYNKVFPASVDLKLLPDTLRAGGEALQEAISANMARDGVLIRREHDFSKLKFVTRMPSEARQARNIDLANKLSQLLGGLSYLAGDVNKVVHKLNKKFEGEWESIPASDREGARMHASSMNFGSRLYSLNRQFLLGIKIEESVEAALLALQEGRKPVIAVENTGESLLRQVLSRRAGVGDLEKQLEEFDERDGALSAEDLIIRDDLRSRIALALRNVQLTEPPQFRELLEIMLDRIGEIKVQGRYGDVRTEHPESEEYYLAEADLRELIAGFPDLPLTPLDVIKHEMGRNNFPVAEVSGRTSSLTMVDGSWMANFHPKTDAVANVAGFQSGKFDAIIITRSGSTGISLHATDRFADSDIRQRDFIVLQKAANIAEFLQWLGRVNRKDQVCDPVITMIESGLPAEMRLTMMHNAKLRKLSANTTSNRENGNVETEGADLLNDVGDAVALEWLFDNPDVAEYLDISLPKDDEIEASRFSQECPYINKLLGRLMMVEVEKQQAILDVLTRRFINKVEELEQRGENPFKVDVYEWGATVVKEEELQSGVLHPSGSTFDDSVKIVTLEYEQDLRPVRSEKLIQMIRSGMDDFRTCAPLDAQGAIAGYKTTLTRLSDDALRQQLPMKLRNSELGIAEIMAANDLPLLKKAKEKQQFLMQNLPYFKPGASVTFDDLFKGEAHGIVTSVDFPTNRDDCFLLSKYMMKVVFPGEERAKEVSLATLFNQEQTLMARSYRVIDLDRMERFANVKASANLVLREFDEVPDGKVTRRTHVLQGNLFRACELASTQKLGAPILFSDAGGNRQRAVLLRDRITPDMVKSLPIGLDAMDIHAYIEEFLRPDHPDHRSRAQYGALRIYDSGVKDMKKGEGIMFEVLNGGRDFRLTMPGTKGRAGALLTDATIFDVGEKTAPGGLALKLNGTRASMQVDVSREVMPVLLRRLQVNNHIGKFYLPVPDQTILRTLKDRYAKERGVEMSPSIEP